MQKLLRENGIKHQRTVSRLRPVCTLAGFNFGKSGATATQASIAGLTNTCVDVVSGVDQAWSIVGGNNSLGSPLIGPAYTTTAGLPGSWLTNSPVSQWDTPTTPITGALVQKRH